MVLKILSIYLLGIILCGIFFGLTVLFQSLLKEKYSWISPLIMPITTIIPIILLFSLTSCSIKVCNLKSFIQIENWLIILATVLLVAYITILKDNLTSMNQSAILLNSIQGMMMEIPQRLFMQTFLYILLIKWKVPHAGHISYILNACVWCFGILAQAFIIKMDNKKNLILDLCASFLFSVGIGYVFLKSELILLPMIAHALERFTSKNMANLKCKK